MRDQYRGGGAGDARHIMVLGQPVSTIAPILRVAGEIERVTERLGRVAAQGYRGGVEYGEGYHEVYIMRLQRSGKREFGGCLSRACDVTLDIDRDSELSASDSDSALNILCATAGDAGAIDGHLSASTPLSPSRRLYLVAVR